MTSRSGSERSPAGTGGAVRVDKWLWAVRVFKTRTAATTACTAGRVRVGDVIEARRGDRTIVYKVAGLIEKRVGAKLVGEYVEDLSPPAPERGPRPEAPPGGARLRGQGRPTKKERRDIDRLRGRR